MDKKKPLRYTWAINPVTRTKESKRKFNKDKLGITLIGLTICVWALIYSLMRGLFKQTPKRFELVEDEKKTTSSTRRNRTETTNN